MDLKISVNPGEGSQGKNCNSLPNYEGMSFLKIIKGLPLKVKIAFIAVLAILLGLSAFVSVKISSKSTDLGLKNIGELSTQAAYYTNVQVLSSDRKLGSYSIPFTQSKYIYTYDGVIKAGVDFNKITYTIDNAAKTIKISLPEPETFSNEVDPETLKVLDESNNIFTPLKIKSFSDSMEELKKESEEKAIANGLYENATANAKRLISEFLKSSHPDYTIEFD